MDLQSTKEVPKWLALSFAISTASIFFSYWIFPSQASILSISFHAIALAPVFYGMMEKEEEVVARRAKPFLKRYDDIIAFLLVICVGIFLSSSLWYNVLPSDANYDGNKCATSLPCREAVFGLQSSVTERDVGTLLAIMLACFILSLFLGAGAILIMTWDVSSLVVSLPAHLGFLAYLPELVAFFLAGLAGALLSFAVMRHEWRSHSFWIVAKDSAVLLAISLLLIPVSSFLFSLL